MSVRCCLPSCIHTSKTCFLKRYPVLARRAQRWDEIIAEHDPKYDKRKSDRLCICHFSSKQYINVEKGGRTKIKFLVDALPDLLKPAKRNRVPKHPCRDSNCLDSHGPQRRKIVPKAEITNYQGGNLNENIVTEHLWPIQPPVVQQQTLGHVLEVPSNVPGKPLGYLFPVQKRGDELILPVNEVQVTTPNDTCMLVMVPEVLQPTVLDPFEPPELQWDEIEEQDFLPIADNVEKLEEFDGEMPLLPHLCRLCTKSCMDENDNVILIFSEQGKSLDLATKIEKHLQINVREDDLLPTKLCGECVQALETCHNLKQRSSQTDEVLRCLLLGENGAGCSPIECSSDLYEAVFGESRPDEAQEPDTAQGDPGVDEDFTIVSFEADPEILGISSLQKRREKRERTFICNIGRCRREFFTKKHLNHHKSLLHKKPWCIKCNILFDSEQVYSEHKDTTHKCLCDVCGSNINEKNLTKHMQLHLPSTKRKHVCSVCNVGFYSKYLLDIHSTRHLEERKHECKICNKKFYHKQDVTIHMKIHAKDDAFKCEKCHSTFRCKRYLQLHTKKLHMNEWMYKCKICDLDCKTMEDITSHVNVHHGDEDDTRGLLYTRHSHYKCNKHCGKYFANQFCLTDHQCFPRSKRFNSDGSSGEAKALFKCDECNQLFHGLTGLSIHKALRHGSSTKTRSTKAASEILIGCEICNETFQKKELLYSHRQKEHGISKMTRIQKFVCKYCDKSFSHKESLNCHIRSHLREKLFQCQYCPKSFLYNDVCRAHECREHTGKTPYKCKSCPKAFYSASQLRVHTNSHTLPFACQFCGKRFSIKKRLEYHENCHRGIVPFKCSFCPKGFKIKHEFETHILNHLNTKKYRCSKCDFQSHKIKEVDTHIIESHSPSEEAALMKQSSFQYSLDEN